LRDACEADGPRIVIINVTGTIELASPIVITDPFITIGGQAAPGSGITLKNHGLRIDTNDVVVRNLRIRPGDAAGAGTAGIALTNANNVVIDHCSVSWSTDAAIAVAGNSRDITVQWCIFSESLHSTENENGPSGHGAVLRAEDGAISFHHNLWAHHESQVPRVDGYPDKPGLLLDWSNNVVYNWGDHAGVSGEHNVRLNFVKNYYKAGPSTNPDGLSETFRFGAFNTAMFYDSNFSEGSPLATGNNFFMLQKPPDFRMADQRGIFRREGPFEMAPVTISAADEAYRQVLAEAGANLPKRDAVDARVAAEARAGTGRIIASQETAGGWPAITPVEPAPDADADGMPDEWEATYKLDATDPNDAAEDADGDGYSNIEEFLNNTAPNS
jgi:pectate lyase